MPQVHALLSHEDCRCDPAPFAQDLCVTRGHPSQKKKSQRSPTQQSAPNWAARKSLEGVRVPKPTARSWNALKIRVMSAAGVQLAGEVLGPPPQPGSWSLSWLPSSDPLRRAKHRFIFTHLVLCNWCVISYRAVGLVPTSPHERALPDVWCRCYCFSLQNYGCGILLSPEMCLLERCVLGSRGTAVDSTFLKISC